MNTSFKNIFKASGAASLGQLLNILNQLALVPLYIKMWGPSQYGEWLILSAAPSVIAMAGDLGFGTVAANEMNIAVARNDRPYALKVFQNNWIVISTFSILFFIVAVIILHFTSVSNGLNIHQIPGNDAKIIIALFLFNLLIMQQNGLLLAALRCDGNYILGLTIGNISRIVELSALAILLVVYHAQPLAIVTTTVSVALVTCLVNRLLVRSKSPWIQYGTENFSLAIIKEQTPVALSFLSFPITQALSIQGAIILVGYLLGPAYVVILSTTRTFMNVIKQVVSVVNASIWPELTTAYGQDDLIKFQTIFVRAVQVILLVVVGFNVSMLLVGKPLYIFWTKGKLVVDNYFFYSFAIVTSISAIWNIFGMVQGATNRTKKYAFYNLCSIGILLVGIISMSKFLGLAGVLLAMFFSETFMLFFVIKNSLSILEIKSATDFFASFFKLRQKAVVLE